MSLLFDPHFTLLRDDQSAKLFNIFLVISQALGGLAILLVAIWMGGYGDGFSWTEDPEREFHYHPTFMVMGMVGLFTSLRGTYIAILMDLFHRVHVYNVFLYGESMLVYRVFRSERKKFSKTLHVCLHSMVLVFMIIALKAVWDSHDLHKDEEGELDPLPNMISLHSWIGLSVVIVFCSQYVVGFVTFFAPGLSIPIRQLVMPFHQLAGMMIFIAVAITVGMGISERAAWKHTCWTKGRELCGQQAVANLVGVCVFGYALFVLLLVANPRWKRRALPEEESLHQLTTTSHD